MPPQHHRLQSWVFLGFLAGATTGCPNTQGGAGSPDNDGDGHDANHDCNDYDALVYPGAPETCDGIDNDCDGSIDADAPGGIWYPDEDLDGFGDAGSDYSCTELEGYVDDHSDCDDTDVFVYPGADETCNEADDDCDGTVDEDVELTFYRDEDQDDFGLTDESVTACTPPDGYAANAGDCNDDEAFINPSAQEACEDKIDNDCDGLVDDEDDGVTEVLWYKDTDYDGFGDEHKPIQACLQPSGYTLLPGDCDDLAAAVNPDATEFCDDYDNDCDDLVDEADANDATTWYEDADNDDYGVASSTTVACDEPEFYSSVVGDCDDGNASSYPGATEVCDDEDNDCDGVTDDDTSEVWWYADDDADTYGDASDSLFQCDVPAGYVLNDLDCDDARSAVHPGATELCNDRDDDCDGGLDVDAVDATTCQTDADSDGYGLPSIAYEGCDPPVDCTNNVYDCDDTDSAINPGADEVCDASDVDEDCNTLADDLDPYVTGTTVYFPDVDGDTHGSDSAAGTSRCEAGGGVTSSDDCDDGNASTYTGASEVCDDEDNDCDGTIDNDTSEVWWYADDDGDTYGDPGDSLFQCAVPSGYVLNALDCNDASAGVHPGATEICNDVDDDCAGGVDDDAVDATTCYTDGDHDGFGLTTTAYIGCDPPASCADNTDDCDDGDSGVNPDAVEVCDAANQDEDCNALADDGDPAVTGTSLYFPDADDDSYGSDASAGDYLCDAGDWVSNDNDCDDGDADIHPGGQEVCDVADDDEDCDGLVETGDPSVLGTVTGYTDADSDTYGDAGDAGSEVCETSAGIADDATDCDDGDGTIHPGALEADNEIDEDCDEWIDETFVGGGDLIVGEFMVDPAGTDLGYEWFEVVNVSSRKIALDGWSFDVDDGSANDTFWIPPDAGLVIDAGARLLFCEDEALFEAAAATASCDYEYGIADDGIAESVYGPSTDNGWSLSSSAATIRIELGALLLDAVAWDTSSGWSFTEGYSLSLGESLLDATDNDDPSSWCDADASEVYDSDTGVDADHGTPGTVGSCP